MPSRTLPDSVTPVSLSSSQIKKIAIIGGGASGAIALDSLVQENHFEEIVLFERRDVLGGVWVLDENPIETPNDIIKAGATSVEIDPPLANPFHEDENLDTIRKLAPNQERFEQTPAYRGMATNIIEKMMTFSDENHWIPDSTNKYVDRGDVRDYIDRYISRNLNRQNVRIVTGTAVEDVEKVHKEAEIPYLFNLTLRHRLEDGTDEWYREKFDAIVVTVGHYHIPFIPGIEGLREIQEKYPGVIQHAKFFRDLLSYKDKTVIVVGSRALGADLTKFTADTATRVYQLIRNDATTRLTKRTNVEFKPVVEKYELLSSGFKVIFKDGTEVVNPDNVVYATGYQFLFPFLNRIYGDVTEKGVIVPGLYQHTFLVNEPLVALVGVPTDAISFRAFEFQAILVARYLTGKIALPTREEQQKWIDDRFETKGLTRAYHTIGGLDSLEYLRTLVLLGRVKDSAINVGREFPQITEEDVAEYRAAGMKLAEFWDEPRIPT